MRPPILRHQHSEMCVNWWRALQFLWLVTVIRVTVGDQRFTITPRGPTLAHPGQLVSILCSAPTPLVYCRITLPGLSASLGLTQRSRPTPRYEYYGRGLQYGQCGVTLPAVGDEDNGVVGCAAGVDGQVEEVSANMTLMVARSPRSPELIVSSLSYEEGDTLYASCSIRDGRPPSNISWTIGDEVVAEGLSEVMYEVDERTDLYSVGQNMTRRLSHRDDGKAVACYGGHVMWGQRYEMASNRIAVKFRPRPTEKQDDNPSLVIGQPGVIGVHLSANPKPVLSWMFGDGVVKEGESVSNGRIRAARPVDQGNGQWRAELLFDTVKAGDFGLYVLVATNEMGDEKYPTFLNEKLHKHYEHNGTIGRMTSEQSVWIVVGIEAAIFAVFLAISTAAIIHGCKHDADEESDE